MRYESTRVVEVGGLDEEKDVATESPVSLRTRKEIDRVRILRLKMLLLN